MFWRFQRLGTGHGRPRRPYPVAMSANRDSSAGRTRGPWVILGFAVGLIAMLTISYFAWKGAQNIGGDQGGHPDGREPSVSSSE